jgi:hypothetical protein
LCTTCKKPLGLDIGKVGGGGGGGGGDVIMTYIKRNYFVSS